MKALVVYESMFGNTRRVATSISRGLARHMEVQLATVDLPTTLDADTFDLIVVGAPTHAFSMSRPQTRAEALSRGATSAADSGTGIREWLGELPVSHAGQLVATFDTRVERVRRLPGSAARAAGRVVGRLGYPAAAPAESFYVADTNGPPLEGELERAQSWGDRLGAEADARAHAG